MVFPTHRGSGATGDNLRAPAFRILVKRTQFTHRVIRIKTMVMMTPTKTKAKGKTTETKTMTHTMTATVSNNYNDGDD